MKSGRIEEKALSLKDLPQHFAVLTVSLFCILSVIAAHPLAAHAAGKNGMAPSSEQIVSRLKDRLNLTDDQVNKIQPIIEESMQKQAALRDQMLQLRQSTDAKISTVLTPEQSKEFQQLKDEQNARMRSRMRRPDAPSKEQP